MDAIELLATRASNGKLTDPAPDAAELTDILDAALRAPDHGAVRPWRVLAVRGEARERLGEVWAEVQAKEAPDTSEDELDRTRRKPLRAPLVLVIAATVREHKKAPEIEQVLSAGALTHGILLGLQARGYAGMWRTGDMAYSTPVKEALGLQASDHIVAYLYVGTASVPAPSMPRPSAKDVLSEWTGPVSGE
ncbi:MAG: nitroreductase [Sandaracinaceae bacterium]